ncbi:MAG: rRNA pseudouridine synthase [Candidatus Dormibacteraeota bacterium]|nr:rRNA pseudouridine synthase [Candidatus Dormibacteraeota bacterium]
MSERLNKYLARSGVASRRAADTLIASGAVLVNGRRPPPEGMLVEPGTDRVEVRGEIVVPSEKHSYIALNKPEGYITTASDPGSRPTVNELLTATGRVFPIGRLDMDSRGLLLLTDDGELANRLAHPRYHVAKEYLALVDGVPGENDLRKLREGVQLEDRKTAPAEVEIVGSVRGQTQVRLTIREGRNRQVRRMLEAVGHPVRDLQRTAFGPLRLGRLKEGDWRRLRQPEIEALRRAAKLD